MPDHLNRISGEIVDAAIRVHTHLGPGLLENVYETCLAYELEKRGHKVERQVQLGVNYDGVGLGVGFKLDLLVDSGVIVELKAVEKLLPIHSAQILTYLKLSNHQLGLLINFNVSLLKDGIKRFVR
ncbi:MAG: GxxExxY protein [Thermoanaerobaculales bacterium]|nr:GxxExxY protein [Thermoanaerobaculales bacterium]